MRLLNNPFSKATRLMALFLFAATLILGSQAGVQWANANDTDFGDPQTGDEGPQDGDDPGCDGCGGGTDGDNQKNSGVCDVPETTTKPILLADGAVLLSATDLSLPGTTFGFRLSRNYNSFYPTSAVGSSSLLSDPIGAKWKMDLGGYRLRKIAGDDIVFIRSTSSKRTFKYNNGTNWTPPSSNNASLNYNASLKKASVVYDIDPAVSGPETVEIFEMTMLGRGAGYKYTFWGFEAQIPVDHRGRIWKKTDRYGQEELTYQHDADGKRIDTITSTQGWTVDFGYTTTSSRHIQTVTAYDGATTSGNITAKVTYYYAEDDTKFADYYYPRDEGGADLRIGSNGDLVGVLVQRADSDGALTIEEWTQYRYHTNMTGLSGHEQEPLPPGGTPPAPWDNQLTIDYYRENDSHYLKTVFDNAALERMYAAHSTHVDINSIYDFMKKDDEFIASVNVPQIQDYATKTFEYYTDTTDGATGNFADDTWGDQVGGGENMELAYGTIGRKEIPFPYFWYNSFSGLSGGVFRVKSEAFGGECSSCSANTIESGLKRTYYYMKIDHANLSDDDVKIVTVEDTQDGDGNWIYRRIWGINQDRLTLRRAKLVNEGGTIKYWCESFLRGASGDSEDKVTEWRTYAAHDGIDTADEFKKFLNPSVATNDADTVNASDGLVKTYVHNSDGYIIERRVKKGIGTVSPPSPTYLVSAVDYGTDAAGGSTSDQPKHLPIARYTYPTKTEIKTLTAGAKTEYEYDFYDTEDTQLKVRITKLPVVDSTQNGPGTAGRAEISEYFDDRGRLRWRKDGEGSVTYFAYHPDTGKLAYRVQDIDTAALSTAVKDGSTTTEPKYIEWDDGSGGDTIPSGFTTGNSDPIALVTTWGYDSQGRQVQRIDPGGAKHFTRYMNDETIRFPYFDGTDVLMPIQITRTNNGGDVTERITLDPAKATVAGGKPTGLSAYTQANYITWSKTTYDGETGERQYTDRYHNIPTTGGALDTDFYRTRYEFDARGRQTHLIQHVSGNEATGKWQVTQTSYDAMDRPVKTERIVSTTGIPSDLIMPSPAYKTIRETLYDGAIGTTSTSSTVGNGYITEARTFYEYGSTASAQRYTGSKLHRTYRGHLRGFEPVYGDTSAQSIANGPFVVRDVDWLGRAVAHAQYSSNPNWSTNVLLGDGYTDYADSTETNRKTLALRHYDDLGRIYRINTVTIDSSDGSAGSSIQKELFYDLRSLIVASSVTGRGGREYAYDGLGQLYQIRNVTELADTKYTSGAFNYRSPTPVASIDTSADDKIDMTGGNDKVIALNHYELDNSGNIIRDIRWAAYHTDTNGIEADAGTKDYIQSSVYSWFDMANRRVADANYGTNNTEYTSAILPSRPTDAPISSDSVLVWSFAYDVPGRNRTNTDPTIGGVDKVTTWDSMGRMIRVQNAAGESEEFGTLTSYDGISNTTRIIADLDNNNTADSADQITEYTYADSHNPYLLTEIAYPDKTGADDVIEYAHHLDGTLNTRTDQRGAEITYDYDNRRRMIEQDLTTVGNADASTGSIAFTYDGLGRLEHLTSYDNTGTPNVTNDILYSYNDFGAISDEYQSHGSAATTSSLKSGYTYDTTSGAGTSAPYTKAMRVKSIVYPNGREVRYNYALIGGDDIGRMSEIRDDDDSDLASYTYLGDGTVVAVDYDQPSLNLDYIQDTTSPYAYKGFDRFGRVIDHRWDDKNSSVDADRFKYGYDRNSNRTYRQNEPTSNLDELYAYDKNGRLKQYGQGTLTSTFDSFGPADESFRQTWTLTDTGNWSNFKEHEGVSLTLQLDQSRIHNKANEIDTDGDHANTKGASITSVGGTPNWFDPVYDAAGNMTEFPKPDDAANGYSAVYDGWGRLVEVKNGSDIVAKYEYDGLGRRIIKKEYDSSGTYVQDRHYYFVAGWRVLEERVNSETTADQQYVWGSRYIDDLILRDRDAASGGDLGVNGSGLDERIYCLQDGNYNVTAIADTQGDVVERFSYSPYGERSVLDADYTLDVDEKSDYEWESGHQGLVHDVETGLIYNRYRYLHTKLGRFIQRDPLQYVDGLNTYPYATGSPTDNVDPLGLTVMIAAPPPMLLARPMVIPRPIIDPIIIPRIVVQPRIGPVPVAVNTESNARGASRPKLNPDGSPKEAGDQFEEIEAQQRADRQAGKPDKIQSIERSRRRDIQELNDKFDVGIPKPLPPLPPGELGIPPIMPPDLADQIGDNNCADGFKNHTVQSGDSCWGIWLQRTQSEISWEEAKKACECARSKNADALQPGETICVPE